MRGWQVRVLYGPQNETLSELRKWSDFAGAKIALSIFSKPFPPTAEAVNSQSSPQLHESVLSLRTGFDPIFSLLPKILKTLLKLCFLTKEKVFLLQIYFAFNVAVEIERYELVQLLLRFGKFGFKILGNTSSFGN